MHAGQGETVISSSSNQAELQQNNHLEANDVECDDEQLNSSDNNAIEDDDNDEIDEDNTNNLNKITSIRLERYDSDYHASAESNASSRRVSSLESWDSGEGEYESCQNRLHPSITADEEPNNNLFLLLRREEVCNNYASVSRNSYVLFGAFYIIFADMCLLFLGCNK